MQHAAQLARGGMSAVLGLEAAQVRDVLQQLQSANVGRVSMANFNSPTQIVISGDLEAVQAASAPMLAAGAKRVVPLNVSGAWHSVLMEPAVARLAAVVEKSHFAMPQFDVISNLDGRPYRDVATIKANLVRSVVEEVRWHDTAQQLLSYDLDRVVEFGASAVLGPLMKRMLAGHEPGARVPAVSVVSDFAGVGKFRVEIERATEATV